jgi:DMSO/TMAO reductase YedYZ molybdopterin-dependent catalytic subunit
MFERQRVFKLIETADNFVKYARPGTEQRAATRARRRLEEATELAEAACAHDLLDGIRLRLDDFDSGAASRTEGVADDTVDIVSEVPPHAAGRVPPHQTVTRGWPVLHVGGVPSFDPTGWDLSFGGACWAPYSLSWDELRALPPVELRSDFHCVTGWSKLDNVWRGVLVHDVMQRARPDADAQHVMVHGRRDYSANLPLRSLLEDDAIVAWGHNGRDLAPKHGWPLRLVVPRLYAWKSVKWVRSFELLTADRRGFWELRGYNNRADPYLEERYSYQES